MNKNVLLIGVGEIGSAIKRIEIEAGNNISVIEQNYQENIKPHYHVCHINIPYSESFIDIVKEYILSGKAESDLYIINSTVKVGTTNKLNIEIDKNFVHSFCRGVHPNLYEGIKTFEKPIGATNQTAQNMCVEHFNELKIPYKVLSSPQASELGKLLDTTYYGYNILFAKAVSELCENYDVLYDEVYTWANKTYNDGYNKLGKPNVIRPVLYPPKGKIGGHCVTPNFKLLPESDLKDWCINQSEQ